MGCGATSCCGGATVMRWVMALLCWRAASACKRRSSFCCVRASSELRSSAFSRSLRDCAISASCLSIKAVFVSISKAWRCKASRASASWLSVSAATGAAAAGGTGLSQFASDKAAETTRSRRRRDFINMGCCSDSHDPHCIHSYCYFRRFTTCWVCRVLSIRSASSTPLKCDSG